jgi:hypothetical protein
LSADVLVGGPSTKNTIAIVAAMHATTTAIQPARRLQFIDTFMKLPSIVRR